MRARHAVIDSAASRDADFSRDYAHVPSGREPLARTPLSLRNDTAGGCIPESRWACVYTHPQAERWADANLRRIGYATYLPLVLIRRRDRVLRSMWHSVEIPAFSRYVFVRHRPGEPVSPIWYAPGVHHLLGKSAENIEYARAGSVEAVEATLASGRTPMAPHPAHWPVAAPVSLLTGGLRLDAIVLRSDARTTTVGCVMLGHLRQITVPTSRLAPRD